MNNTNLDRLKGRIVRKEDDDYDESRLSWNRAIDVYPEAIVYCLNKEEVENNVKWCIENNVQFRIRNGAHNYEGYSTGDDIIVIDLSRMNKINLDEENNMVTIDGGVRNREAYDFLCSKGYPFPGGGCPTVGIAGLTLGGGWGYSSRFLGLACDSLMEIEFIDYKGNLITANSNTHEDLFWASKGCGGGNFGVVVSMTFKLAAKVENVTLIDLEYTNLATHNQVTVIRMYEKMFNNLDNKANFKMAVYNSNKKGRGIKIIGLYYGEEKEAKNILMPFINLKYDKTLNLTYTSILEANRIIQDSHPDYEKYKSTGRFIYKEYSEEEIEQILNLLNDSANGSVYTAITFYGLGGAVKDKDKDESAFYYRDAKFIMGFQSVFEDDKYKRENIEWFLAKFKYIRNITQGSFINFPLTELENYHQEYYGNNYEKLKRIKYKYDPYNKYNFEQSI
ncbi:FAD-dependent oxidoreductase [Clostridium butyricum]|uniref:FAD-dependent oxidoreductase n=1 Tax=Clostridium butyricum TaxID=1492 RepID=UPI0005EBC12E|nr:FAD-binding oxidoreductase [Clostridium butyricum]MDU3582894.1 FAD-binding oxidoreductase [Clostridium butyricum]MDU3595979.1 FAD-binding oxidoreductase [Clostridium butyricum]